jgi:hypothetical protein
MNNDTDSLMTPWFADGMLVEQNEVPRSGRVKNNEFDGWLTAMYARLFTGGVSGGENVARVDAAWCSIGGLLPFVRDSPLLCSRQPCEVCLTNFLCELIGRHSTYAGGISFKSGNEPHILTATPKTATDMVQVLTGSGS